MTLTISEFTSAQAQGSARSDRPPNRLVIKDKGAEEGMKEGTKKKEGREGRSVAISFQTLPLKCAEMTQAFTYGVRTRL